MVNGNVEQKKNAFATLINGTNESKKRKAETGSSGAPAKKPRTKKTETPKKREKKQATLFDHFKKKDEKSETGSEEPKYPQKLLDTIDVIKSMEGERETRHIENYCTIEKYLIFCNFFFIFF